MTGEKNNKKKRTNISMVKNESDRAKYEDIFLEVGHLKVLYYLAKKNPRITPKTISEELKINETTTQQILSDLAYERLAIFETRKGYTLTPEGLATLYNFHINYSQ